MKKTQLVLLVLIAAAIAVLVSYISDVSTYETIASAQKKQGKTVMIIAKLNKESIVYDPIQNPNYLSFEATDSLGDKMKVAYYYEKPYDMEKSERIVLKGKMENGIFEIKKKDGILIKCPSKYKDDLKASKKQLETSSIQP